MELTKEKKDKLLALLNDPMSSSRRAHVISSHYDPDSLACIWLMKLFLELYVKCVDIYLPGKPDNFLQNGEIVSKFGLADHILQINADFLKRIQPEDLIVFVDTPTFEDSRFPVKIPKPHILIDHHTRPANMSEEAEKEWYWYDNCGACVSMVTKLMIECDAFKDLEEVDLKKATTLGILGLLGDSKKLTSRHTSVLDYEMAAFLRRYADQEKIYTMSYSSYDESFLPAIGIENDRWRREGTVVAYRMNENEESVGTDCNMPKMAELLMMFGEVKTVFVWILFENRVSIKARNSNQAYDLDGNLKRMFGDKNGGAKDNATGAAMIKFDFFNDCSQDDREKLLKVCDGIIKRKIFGK